MAAPRMNAKERERAAREAAARRSKLGIRLGAAGTALLFLAGLGVAFYSDLALVLLGLMIVAIVIILAGFMLVRGAVRDVGDLSTKIL